MGLRQQARARLAGQAPASDLQHCLVRSTARDAFSALQLNATVFRSARNTLGGDYASGVLAQATIAGPGRYVFQSEALVRARGLRCAVRHA
jgi:hypothetical protein